MSAECASPSMSFLKSVSRCLVRRSEAAFAFVRHLTPDVATMCILSGVEVSAASVLSFLEGETPDWTDCQAASRWYTGSTSARSDRGL
jgi:hypothetical protein